MSTGNSCSRNTYLGVACVLLDAIGFSAKPTLVKLGYQYGVDPMTLILSYPVLTGPITAVQIAGAALVLAGVGLVSVRPKAAASV